MSLLSGGPTHGYELKQRRDRLFGATNGPVNIGQVYVTLGRLEKDGLVSHTTTLSATGPQRKVYELTQDGEKEVRLWFERQPAPPEMKSDATVKILMALEAGSPEIANLVRGHRQQCLEGLRALEMELAVAPPVTAALLQAAALHLEADLRWLDHIETQVAAPAPRGDLL